MRRFAALGAVLVLLLAAAPVASADPGKANPGKSDEARAEHQATTDFWTVERARRAKPRDFVRLRGTDRFVPAKPGKGKGKPGGSDDGGGTPTDEPWEPGLEDESGAEWNRAGVVSKVTGKVFFQFGKGRPSLYKCSATAVTDEKVGNSRSLILTAAHCVYDNKLGYAKRWIFVPDYDSRELPLSGETICEKAPYGCWTSSALVLHNGFATAGSFNETAVVHDFAFSVVEKGGLDGATLLADALAGGSPSVTEMDYPAVSFLAITEAGATDFAGDDVFAFGYPVAFPYGGNQLIYCRTDITFDSRMADQTYGMLGCTHTGGASGGGWQTGFDEGTGNGTLRSVNSYSWSDHEAMYGPKFNGNTEAVFDKALDATENASVG